MSYPKPLHWWTDNVLPLVYDDSLSYYEVMSKIVTYINGITQDTVEVKNLVNELKAIIENSDIDKIPEILTRLDEIDSTISALNTDNTQNKADISTLKTDNTQNKADISVLKTDNTQNKADISTLKTDNTQNKADITTLKTDNTQNKADISVLKTDNTQNKADIVDLKSAISGLELYPENFKQGYYTSDSTTRTSDSTAPKRICYNNKVKIKKGMSVYYNLSSGWQISLFIFPNEPGTAQTASQRSDSWVSGNGLFTANNDGYLVFNLKTNTESSITPSDYDSVIIAPGNEKKIFDLDERTSAAEFSIVNGGVYNDFAPTSSDFSQGYIAPDSVPRTSDSTAPNRIYLTNAIRCRKNSTVTYSMASNQQASFKVFANKPGIVQSELQKTAWLSGSGTIKINYDGYIINNIKASPETAITPSDYNSSIVYPKFDEFPYVQNLQTEIEEVSKNAIGSGSNIYFGEKIQLGGYMFNAQKIGDDKITGYEPQGACIYGNLLFQMFSGSKFSVYDLTTNINSGIYSFDPQAPSIHCNSACFGNKQNSADEFPLLYVNSYLDSVDKGTCCVEKIVENNGTYTTQHIQTIKIGFIDNVLWTGATENPVTRANGNFIVDTLNNRLIAYTSQGYERTRFFVFGLPTLSESEVILNISDIIYYFDTDYIDIIQDSCVKNGVVYITAGMNYGANASVIRIYAVNLKTQAIVSIVPLEQSRVLNYEPEGIDYYNNSLIITNIQGHVVRLDF